MGVFDSKTFNSEVFSKYLESVPRVKQNQLLKAGILRVRPELKNMLTEQTGGNFVTVPMSGHIGGTAKNYDGSTNITADGLETFTQAMIVVGRAQSWLEKDFTKDITGKDFMEVIASQVGDYWDDVDQATMLSILKGIFTTAMPNSHTLDITSQSGSAALVGATTLNTAMNNACGANKGIFKCVVMHSDVATNLENLQVLSYWKETDAEGMQKDMALATWNGRVVLIDDEVPVTAVEADGNDPAHNEYTTYILGEGAFDYCDCGAKVPNETHRDPLTHGGEDYLISRQRKLFAPRGFNFVQPNTAIISPTNTHLETGARWSRVADSAGTGYFDSKAIPFARIISRG